jgi:hypothetical protein
MNLVVRTFVEVYGTCDGSIRIPRSQDSDPGSSEFRVSGFDFEVLSSAFGMWKSAF